jgi:hypothetical protein
MVSLKLRNNEFLDSKFISFLSELYAHNLMVISRLKDERGVIALSFILKGPTEYLFWIDMYDNLPYINLNNYLCFLKNISSTGPLFINLGRGTYPFKTNNFKPLIEGLFTFYYSKSWLRYLLFTAQFQLKSLLKKLIKK